MNKELRDFFQKNHIITQKITIKNNIRIIDTGNKTFVIKKKESDLDTLYQYLKSRSFDYYPKLIDQTRNYEIYEYIEDTCLEKEERAMDIIKLLTLLHSKTTYYKEIDDDTYKTLYEDISDRLNYLFHYYQDIVEIIEQEEYMSPSHYLFIRNVSKLFQVFGYCQNKIETWYQIISEKKRVRITQIHNNLRLEHYLLGNKPYLISWNKSKKDMPIYDLVLFYQRYYKEFDFCNLLRNYENHYPMLPEEKLLFSCLISIPIKIDFQEEELPLCQKIRNFYDYIFTTDKLINDYFPQKEDKIKK